MRGDRRVDADELAVHVDQRAAGVTGVDRGIGLDRVEHGVLVLRVSAGGHRPIERTDDPRGDRALEPQRRTDGDDVLTHPQIRRGPDRDRSQPGDVLGADHRDVTARVGPDDVERRAAAVGEGHLRLRADRRHRSGRSRAATTWLLVRISPSVDRMTPEPSSDCLPSFTSSFTTLGTTLAATCSTEPVGHAGGRHARRRTRRTDAGGAVIGVHQRRDTAADSGRDDGDRHRTGGQTRCAGTLLRRTAGGPSAYRLADSAPGPGRRASARRDTGRRATDRPGAAARSRTASPSHCRPAAHRIRSAAGRPVRAAPARAWRAGVPAAEPVSTSGGWSCSLRCSSSSRSVAGSTTGVRPECPDVLRIHLEIHLHTPRLSPPHRRW